MTHQDIIDSFTQLSRDKYPSTKNFDFEKAANLLSDFAVPIPQKIVTQIKNFVELIYKVSRQPNYISNISTQDNDHLEKIRALNVRNKSVLMAYDFHIEDDRAQLIEVNTNASGYLISNLLSLVNGRKDYLASLKESFENEFAMNDHSIKRVAIVDEDPFEQNMLIEFQMYNDLFKSWGYSSSIHDVKELYERNGYIYNQENERIDFVYNRFCDFYLEEERSQDLFKAYLSQKTIFSPQPKEYLLLADKNRMTSWYQKNWQEKMQLSADQVDILKQTIAPIHSIDEFEPEDLWTQRRQYFFKPSQSFGGKSVYRGKSITKKNFERLLKEKTLVQKYVPAPTHTEGDNKWKYEIRAYCYKDQIQQLIVRSYQGQVTNFKTPGGGFSLVNIS